MKTYLVYSPEFMRYSATDIDPPEYGACALEVEAPTQKEAIRIAIKDKEFRRWVQDARSDGKNPFVGLKAETLEDYVEKFGIDV